MESSDFSKSDGSWSESVCSLDSTGGWGLTFGLFVSDVLSWLLSSSVLSCGVLGSCHFKYLLLLNLTENGAAFKVYYLNNLCSDWLEFSN